MTGRHKKKRSLNTGNRKKEEDRSGAVMDEGRNSEDRWVTATRENVFEFLKDS